MKILIKDVEINKRTTELGKLITNTYPDDGKLVVIVVLKGAYMFASDLTKNIIRDCYVEFIKVSSYGDETKSSGKVTLDLDVQDKPEYYGSNILIVEDIVDTGNTVLFLKEHFRKFNPKSVRVASLLWKSTSKVKPDFYGFEIPLDEFVVGRGLDYKGLFRTLINVYSIEKNELL